VLSFYRVLVFTNCTSNVTINHQQKEKIGRAMISITTDFTFPFGYSKESDCISVELSCIEDSSGFTPPRDDIQIISEKTGKAVTFTFASCDYDTSHEDIMGFNYRSTDKSVKTTLLVIND